METNEQLPTVCLFVEGTFLPSREGATRRFLGVARNLSALGHKIVVVHCYRGWSDLSLIDSEEFITYAVAPDVYYECPGRIAPILRSENVEVMQFAEIETIHSVGIPLKSFLPTVALAYECHDVHSTFLRSVGARMDQVNPTIRIEREVLPHCDLIFCFTAEDMAALRGLGADSERMFLVSFGIDTTTISAHGPCLTEKNILFLGNLYHWPNQEAFKQIVTAILPAARLKNLGCTFVIVGDYPIEMERYAAIRDLQFCGPVDSLSGVFSKATIAIAPVTTGSGIKVKVLDYFAAGLPTVGTEMAFRGLPKAGLVVPNAVGMLNVIQELLADHEQLRQLGRAARLAAESVNWLNIRQELSEVYKKAVNMREPEGFPGEVLRDLQSPRIQPYFLEENISGARFEPRPHAQFEQGTIVKLGRPHS